MSLHGLTKSLCFGAAIAIAFVFAQHVAAPIVGSANVFIFYLASCAIAYAALLGSTPRRALRNVLAAFAGTALVVLLSSESVGLVIGLTVVLAFVRSGLEYSTEPGRAFVIEMLLGGVALGFASWVASSGGWLGEAAGLWTFSLVQSLYFLVPGRSRRKSASALGDPFERARDRLLGLLEEV